MGSSGIKYPYAEKLSREKSTFGHLPLSSWLGLMDSTLKKKIKKILFKVFLLNSMQGVLQSFSQ